MRAYLLVILILLTSLQSILAQREVTVDGKTASDAALIYDGIDVSSYQEDIDWSATAKDRNIKFVYVKATEGQSYKSRHYIYNIENARKHGIRVGSYHFFRPTVPVQKQFDNFTSIVKLKDQDLVPLIDIETKAGMTGAQIADSVLAFAKLLERHYGCRPMIYTGNSFYNSNLQGRLKGYKLFIARYSKSQPKLADAQWTLWQFSERGRITGIDNYVDLCRFNKGCGLSDILIKGRGASHRIEGNTNKPVPPRKTEPKKQQQPVPLSKKEIEKQRKAKEKAEKEAAKRAKEKARIEAEKTKKLEKEKKRAFKKVRENQKEAAQKAAKEKKKLQEQEAKTKKENEQRIAKQKAAQQKAQQTARNQSANQKAKEQGKRINGSSVDNPNDM